jgi:NAD(P)H-quinone oxidoreductase subunit 6
MSEGWEFAIGYLKWFLLNITGAAQPHLHFFMLSFVTIASAIGVVVARNLVHAAMLLALCFVAVAGIFILLNAEFLAAVQVLVYAGGVVTLIIFAIMLSENITGEKAVVHNRQSVTALGISVMMAIVMVAILLYDQNGYFVGPTRWALPPERNEFPTSANTLLIGRSLMSTYTLAFWIASIILTVAMIGALILAKAEKSRKEIPSKLSSLTSAIFPEPEDEDAKLTPDFMTAADEGQMEDTE